MGKASQAEVQVQMLRDTNVLLFDIQQEGQHGWSGENKGQKLREWGSNMGRAGHGSGNIQPGGTYGASVGFTWQSGMVDLCLKRIMYCFYHS